MTERKPHKWKKVITAWANGFPIQFKVGSFSEWTDYDPEALKRSNISSKYFPFYIPRFDLDFEWRIKPGQTKKKYLFALVENVDISQKLVKYLRKTHKCWTILVQILEFSLPVQNVDVRNIVHIHTMGKI